MLIFTDKLEENLETFGNINTEKSGENYISSSPLLRF